MLDRPLQESLFACSIMLQKHMSDLLPVDFADSRLIDAMRYCVLSDGKRIRPFLLMATADIFGVNVTKTLNAAAAIEFVHVYSLIHDDLPAMDNDDLRRGIQTCHKKYDEATAILAGDALLTYAFEILASVDTHADPAIRCELVTKLASSSGFRGMAGGQMMDLEKQDQKEISNETLAKLHRLKTGELFMASVGSGAILGYASPAERASLRNYAHDLGLAFQIKDDILDHQYGISEEKTKTENASIVDALGIDNAKIRLEMLKEQAIAHLKSFGDKARLLRELAGFVVERNR
ncbi:MAG: polyprenyl synthetase family protein [Rickettsiales bacterium]|nr:polyprenyl synthetase family protein [Rickettsiales bacterium]